MASWYFAMSAILLTHASQLLTLRGHAPRRGASMRDLGIILDGAVLIENGRISEYRISMEVTFVLE